MRVPLDDGKPALVSVKNVNVVRDFYSTRDARGSLDDSFEHWMGEGIERSFIETIREIVDSGQPLVDSRRQIVAQWVALQLLRTPASRSFNTYLRDVIFRSGLGLKGPEDLANYLGQRGRDVSRSEAKELWEIYIDLPAPEYGGSAEQHLALIREHQPRMAEQLAMRGWTLVRAYTPDFVSSDAPVATRLRTKPDDDGQLWGVFGEVVVAVDRSFALIINEDRGPDTAVTVHDRGVRLLVQQLVTFARDAVFHDPSRSPLESIRLPSPYRRRTSVEQWLAKLTED